MKFFCLIVCTLFFIGCHSDREQIEETLFTLLDSARTGINFENNLTSTDEFNIYTYRNFYNGGGVGIGDVNNDGLQDIYLTANMEANRLYINKGAFRFQDVTGSAGVAGKRAWATGVSMVDINADGWLDIYVCNSGDITGANKQNEFFINNGDGTFTDQAASMGLADQGFSTHVAFLDYDKDGDLDAYLLNNSFTEIGSANLMKNQRPVRDPGGGDKLYRNEGGFFTDVSEAAGIYGSYIGFGLGVSVSDLNKDGWLDLYISNDFFERDYIYMNNGDGTFAEDLENQMRSLSIASMGSDAADINGDTYPDIFVTEMLPEAEDRLKTLIQFESWDKYRYNVRNDYHHQFMRNMLHVHNGLSGKQGVTFTEMGRQLGVEATDWSWGALIVDLDNDGFKDIFVSNGIYQDIIDQDYLRYISNETFVKSIVQDGKVDFNKLIEIIPSAKISNYAFAGEEGTQFTNRAKEWGLATPSHSNGSAYGDLDNDGDLDLIVNNVNMPAFVYRNNTDSVANYLKIDLKGDDENVHAIGANVTLKSAGKMLFLEQSLARGFQSSADPRLNFGLGTIEVLDSVIVRWHNGAKTVLTDVSANQTLYLEAPEESPSPEYAVDKRLPANPVFRQVYMGPVFKHDENRHVDFQVERMLYHMSSTEGPKITVGDLNGDGLEDFHVGGARKQPGKIFLQSESGFVSTNEALLAQDRFTEDAESVFFDADNDGDTDIYVASGGNDDNSLRYLQDRLYLNNGNGRFTRSESSLPDIRKHTSVVTASDFDQDGDADLFVGVRLEHGSYGVPQTSYLLLNDGHGNFTRGSESLAPDLINIGMVTDASWSDYDNDKDPDLIVVGEWMSPKVLRNNNGKFTDASAALGLNQLAGWWNTLEAGDLNKDGSPDFVLGNHGLNSRFKASEEQPIRCYVNDFDQNGAVEQIITQYNGEEAYPFALLHELLSQMPSLKKRFVNYKDYKLQGIEELFSSELIEEAVVHKVTTLESVALVSDSQGGFQIVRLPEVAQVSPVYSIGIQDYDMDGQTDLLLGGNLFGAKPDVGRYDANYGILLQGDGTGNFKEVSVPKTGLYLKGEVRDFEMIRMENRLMLIVARNNDSLVFYEPLAEPLIN